MQDQPNQPSVDGEETPKSSNEPSFYQQTTGGVPEGTENGAAESNVPAPTPGVYEWDVAEYIHHPKGMGWIVGLVLIAALFSALAVWLHAWTFLALVVVMAIAFGIIAFRPPRMMHYRLTPETIEVNGQSYNLGSFRSYGMISEGDFHTVMLVPAKRFAASISVFFNDEHGSEVVTRLAPRLPVEPIHEDLVEHLMRYLRF
ncbi:MAG TPA: hypothetical protein VNG90_02105 [Candidatus Acidoferrum sp.]|nr:hypothetical protein [Candidatus Acidoferrum sp.]